MNHDALLDCDPPAIYDAFSMVATSPTSREGTWLDIPTVRYILEQPGDERYTVHLRVSLRLGLAQLLELEGLLSGEPHWHSL
jgi:hypothetical protein